MAPDIALDPAGWLNAKAYANGWATRADASLGFACLELSQMHELWNSIAGENLPSRAQFTARLMKPYMRQLSILAIEGPAGQPRRYCNRYVGSSIVRWFGELTGKCLEDFLPEALMPRTLACYDAVVEGKRPLRMISRFQLEKTSFLSCEIFVAPLAEDGLTPNMILSVIHFFGLSDKNAPTAALPRGLHLS